MYEAKDYSDLDSSELLFAFRINSVGVILVTFLKAA
jgi:hypothetical protein